MTLTLRLTRDEDERFLAEEAARVVRENSPTERVRRLRDSRDPVGWSRDLWGTLADLGWLALTVSEERGGAGMGVFAGTLLTEEAGRRLMPEPLVPTMLALEVLARCASERRASRLIARIVSGDAVVAVALDEPKGRWNYETPTTIARRDEGRWTLDGRKIQVHEGHLADTLIVPAATERGVGLFEVEWDASGLRRTRQTRIDGRGAALIDLEAVSVGPQALLDPGDGDPLDAGPRLRAALDRATILLAAEMLGGACEAFALTLAYLKERKQFGVPIGSFQALQHRAARVFMSLEMTRSAVVAAARTADAPESSGDEVAKMASLAKAVAGDAYMHAAAEGVQMHGGVGVTDEYDIGLHLKRARCAQATWGDTTWHRRRWARLSGY
jgi:alkylation response protein AidB-like acyl-CoA dehydrogenase